MRDTLSLIGLTATESTLYLALLDLGKSQAGALSRKTGIHRRSVYDALERLIEKGLVSWIKENEERFYLAEDPQQILRILHEQEHTITQILPALQAKHNAKHVKEETRFYRGIEGIKSVLYDQISAGAPVQIFGASRDASRILKYFLPHYTSARVGKRIKLSLIYAGKPEKKQHITYGEVRYLPDSYASPVSTNIYADRVAIIIWSDDPMAILIRNASVAESYRAWFSLLWRLAKP